MLKCQIIGNIGSDPELRYSASGSAFLRINVASNYRAKNEAGEWEDKTEWLRCTLFGNRAESLAERLTKGSRIYLDGRLEARPWTDREGGVRAGLEITVDTIDFMSPKQDGAVTPNRTPADDNELEDLPF